MIAVLLLNTVITSANNSLLLQQLDSILETSETIVAERNKRVELLKQMAAKETNRGLLLERYRERTRIGKESQQQKICGIQHHNED